MFIDLFYLMRARGLNVSMNEWLSLMDALEKGLCRNSLLEFYYLSRAILIKTEADFDKFDEVFLDYFDRIQHIEDIPQELMDWLHDPKNMKKYDKDEVDARTTYDLEKLRQMLEERLQEQHERHDGLLEEALRRAAKPLALDQHHRHHLDQRHAGVAGRHREQARQQQRVP